MEEISESKKIQKIVSSLQPKKSAKSFRFKSFNISRNSSSFPHRSSFSLNSKKFLKEKQDPIQMINPNTLVYESPFFQKNKNYNELCKAFSNRQGGSRLAGNRACSIRLCSFKCNFFWHHHQQSLECL